MLQFLGRDMLTQKPHLSSLIQRAPFGPFWMIYHDLSSPFHFKFTHTLGSPISAPFTRSPFRLGEALPEAWTESQKDRR